MYMKQVLFYFGCSKWLRSMLVNHWNHIHKWSFQEICNASPPPHSPPHPSASDLWFPALLVPLAQCTPVCFATGARAARSWNGNLRDILRKKAGYMALQMENTCLLWMAFTLVPNFSLRPCLKFFRMPQHSPLQRAGELQGRPRGQDTDIQTFAQNIYIHFTFLTLIKTTLISCMSL